MMMDGFSLTKFTVPGAIYSIAQRVGVTDGAMVFKEDNNRCRLLCIQAHGFDFWRTDYRLIICPPKYTPDSSVLMVTVPMGRPPRMFRFLKN